MMEQRSEEWFAERRCRITASRFGDVLAKPTTKRYQTYMQEVVDGLIGVPEFKEDEKPWFRHGKTWEEEARASYEWDVCMKTGDWDFKTVVPGLIVHPKYDFIAASPDFLVGDNGGGEIKCHKSRKQHDITIEKGMPSQHKPQVQGGMFCTDREWWDFVSYFKSEDGKERDTHTVRIFRDDEYISNLETACLDFWVEANRRAA
jgi:putative phage-type endonuclease